MEFKNMPVKVMPVNDDPLTRRIIACAIEVHKKLGPGLLEKLYREAMLIELNLQGLEARKNVEISVSYKGNSIGEYYIDILVVLQRKVAPCAVPGAGVPAQHAAGDGGFERDLAL